MSNTLMPNLLQRLRPLVGFEGWDYCVLWHLSQDQRSIEWIDCCCGGTKNMNENDGEKLHFPAPPLFLCRDTISQHPRSNPCHLLALLPSSMPLDSGCYYSLTLLSNQPKWLNLSSSSDSTALQEIAGTKVLIPVAFGIIELFVSKQISEDQQVIDFIISQCTISTEQESMASSTFMDISFSFDRKDLTDNQTKYFHPRISPTTTLENFNLNFLQRSDIASDSRTKNGTFDESSQEMETFQKILMNSTSNDHMQFMENSAYDELQWDDKELVKQKSGSSESLSDCSDQINDNDNVKCHRRTGQVLKSKNLMAERRRRKKLNDRLFALRALVPKISKMHKAAILEDAIEFVKELQQQVEELQEELEGGKNTITNNGSHSIDQTEFISQNAVSQWPNSEQDRAGNACKMGNFFKQNQDSESANEISQQMEPQLKVAELNDREFFVKVLCENKRGGFTRLMEALNSLGMEVSSANMTCHRGLVSNVLRVVKKDNETVQPDRLRDSLLEITRHPSSGVA